MGENDLISDNWKLPYKYHFDKTSQLKIILGGRNLTENFYFFRNPSLAILQIKEKLAARTFSYHFIVLFHWHFLVH